MNTLKSIGIFCLMASSLLSAAPYSQAKRVTTRLSAPAASHEKQHRQKRRHQDTASRQKIIGSLGFLAYDKKTNAPKETFFIDNGSDIDLDGLNLEISYFNSAGKLIHRRNAEISTPLPAKETRKVDIPSWDTQKSYHYINSVPSRKGSSPYTVRFKILSVTPAQ